MKKRKNIDAPFQEGDLVTTEYDTFDKNTVRKVTAVVRWDRSQSGWAVAADAGTPCPTCGRAARREIDLIDSTWFKRAQRIQKK